MRFLILLPMLAQTVLSLAQTDFIVRDPATIPDEIQNVTLERRDGVKTYMAWASDPHNKDELQKTREFLNSTIVGDDHVISVFEPIGGDLYLWGGLRLDDVALQKVKSDSRIKKVKEEPEVKDFFAFQRDHFPNKRDDSDWWSHWWTNLAMRWSRQNYPSWGLAYISLPPDMPSNLFPDFVYSEQAGEGAFIYVLDRGIAYTVETTCPRTGLKGEEFSSTQLPVLQTDTSKDNKEKEDQDDSTDRLGTANSHGTGIASVALGRCYGFAKKATLISVKTAGGFVDRLQGMKLIADDNAKHPERAGKVVVLAPSGVFDDKDEEMKDIFKKAYEPLLKKGVAIVVASGNVDEEKKSAEIDHLPMTLSDVNNFPLIVVGAVGKDGKHISKSQGGAKLTVYAPGDDIPYSNKYGGTNKIDGTSVAAAEVAGLVASYMAYDTMPWPEPGATPDMAYLKHIVGYLRSKDSSQNRNAAEPNTRIVWNGATDEDHEKAGTKDAPFAKGTCSVHVTRTQVWWSPSVTTRGWEGELFDNSGAAINGCKTGYVALNDDENFVIKCETLGYDLNASEASANTLEFKIGVQAWSTVASAHDEKCDVQVIQDGADAKQIINCNFDC